MQPSPEASPQGPLAGLRVVELAGIGPAPHACMILAELGADVVRVERPGGASPLQGPVDALNRSRPNVAVNLKDPQGVEAVRRLVDGADVLVEGLRPGVTERLGLGPEELLGRNPRLVYARMTGWGQDGPWALSAGHDITYAAITGALHLVGERGKPVQPVNVLADFGGGSMFLLVGILAALHSRQSTGRGQIVDAAMVDGAASLVSMIYGMYGAGRWTDEREANLLDGGMPFYATYECQDGKHVAVGPLEPQFYRAFVELLGVDLEGGQFDNLEQHRAAIATAFRSRSRDEWAEVFDGSDACVAPVLSLAEAPHHPHIEARGIFVEVSGSLQPRVAPRFSETPGLDPTPGRAVGADTTAYLASHGFTAQEVDALLATGAVVQG